MVKVLYLSEGSQFAGVEVYTINLLKAIFTYTDIESSCALFYGGMLGYVVKNLNVELCYLHGRRNIKSIARIREIVNANGIQIIHCTDLKSTIIGGIAAICLDDVKTVATVHGLPEIRLDLFWTVKYLFSLFIYFLLLRFSISRIICVSEDLARRIRAVVGMKSVAVIHNGLDTSTIVEGQGKAAVNLDFRIIGTVGRLDQVKGHSFLLEAFRQIRDVREDVKMIIVGSGPLERDLRKQARMLSIEEEVQFLGFRRDVYALIAGVDIFVLPSLHEGIPFALLEAMSLGKPVVCTAVGGIREVVENAVDGLLIPHKDSAALCRAILTLLDNPSYATALGKNARMKIEKQFSAEFMARQTHALYLSLIGEGA